MNRRGFLGALLSAAVLDPEKLLWVPGQKLISIPPPSAGLSIRFVSAYEMRFNCTMKNLSVANFSLPKPKGFFECVDPSRKTDAALWWKANEGVFASHNLSVANAEALVDRMMLEPAVRYQASVAIQRVRQRRDPCIASVDYL